MDIEKQLLLQHSLTPHPEPTPRLDLSLNDLINARRRLVHYNVGIHSQTLKGNFDACKYFSLPKQQVLLMLNRPMPTETQACEIHKELCKILEDSYRTCHRQSSGEMIILMRSDKDAQDHWGKDISLKGTTYTLEYVSCHSQLYVCDDVRGMSTEEVLHHIDKFSIAAVQAIGLWRQKKEGPLVAFEFGAPLEGFHSIKLGDFEFTRARSACELCKGRHILSECQDMVKERETKPPNGAYVRIRYETGPFLEFCNGILEGEDKKKKGEDKKKKGEEWQERLERWYEIEKKTLKEVGEGGFLNLG